MDLKECIRYCIENFSKEEATERIYKYINDSLELKEKEIEFNNFKLIGYSNGELFVKKNKTLNN